VTKKFWLNPGRKPRFKMARDKYILIMERVKQLETYQLRLHTLGFTREITLPLLSLTQKYNRVTRAVK
jgi:hypothetical protein